MKLHRTFVPSEGITRSFRHPPGHDWFGALVFALPAAGALWALPDIVAGSPWWLLLVVSPFALLLALLYGVILVALFGAALAARRPSNWLVKFTDHGVFLNLRSYRNAHFGPADGTVAALSWGEIASAGRLVETAVRADGPNGGRERTTRVEYVELVLHSDAGPIRDAVAAEMQREPEQPGGRGATNAHGSTKHHHYPVLATGNRTVRIEALNGLLEAFGEQVRPAPGRTLAGGSIAA